MRPYSHVIDRLRAAGLRPTRQRLALARLLFENGHRHITAEKLHAEVLSANVRVSLATVYNTLHQFTACGLLREIVVDASRSYFDTNITHHHHYFVEDSGELMDIADGEIGVTGVPSVPPGMAVRDVQVIVRVCRENPGAKAIL